MESVWGLGGLVLLRDSVEWEGRSLLKALVKKSALCGEQVHILGCEVSEDEFREGFDSSINSRLVYHDLFRDPFNWSQAGEALPGGPLGALRALCRRTEPGPVTIALDSLSWLLLHLPCTTLCQALCALSQQHSPLGETPLRSSYMPSPAKEQALFHPKKNHIRNFQLGLILSLIIVFILDCHDCHLLMTLFFREVLSYSLVSFIEQIRYHVICQVQ